MDTMSYLLIAGLVLLSVCSIISRVLSKKAKRSDGNKKEKPEKS